MAPKMNKNVQQSKKRSSVVNKGAWTAEEDKLLSEYIEEHGAKKWKTVALRAGLNRCGKSCRLRWLNYLRPCIKRGNISSEEEDLILRLHKLLGNRWSLIAGRLPGRTDNEIKNYWNSHLSKKINQEDINIHLPAAPPATNLPTKMEEELDDDLVETVFGEETQISFDVSVDFSAEKTCECDVDWADQFLELDETYNAM